MERTLETPSVKRVELRPWGRCTGTTLDTENRILCVCVCVHVYMPVYPCLSVCVSQVVNQFAPMQRPEEGTTGTFLFCFPLTRKLAVSQTGGAEGFWRFSHLCLPSDIGALELQMLILHPAVCDIRGSKLMPAYMAALYTLSLLQSKFMLSLSYLVSEILFQQHTQAKTK